MAIMPGMAAVLANEDDFALASYDFELPPEQIAQYPPAERGASRLMAISLQNADLPPAHTLFSHLPELLPAESLLVANNSRVMPARLSGRRPGGGLAEFLLLTPPPLIRAKTCGHNWQEAEADGLIRPAGKIRPGTVLDFAAALQIEIIAKGEFGQCRARMRWHGDLFAIITHIGKLPLPPYIRRQPENMDVARYQTVYASNPGSVAAPTAGLHFTAALRQQLATCGHEWVELGLHVGYGTFSPVRGKDIRTHAMHAEYVDISEVTAAAVNDAIGSGRPIVAIGTTSLRAIEGVFRMYGRIAAYKGHVNIFLYPGEKINVINGLVTNFHLPRSTLLMLVSALAGRRRILAAYAEAVAAGYRFFSYGDAMLLA